MLGEKVVLCSADQAPGSCVEEGSELSDNTQLLLATPDFIDLHHIPANPGRKDWDDSVTSHMKTISNV